MTGQGEPSNRNGSGGNGGEGRTAGERRGAVAALKAHGLLGSKELSLDLPGACLR